MLTLRVYKVTGETTVHAAGINPLRALASTVLYVPEESKKEGLRNGGVDAGVFRNVCGRFSVLIQQAG